MPWFGVAIDGLDDANSTRKYFPIHFCTDIKVVFYPIHFCTENYSSDEKVLVTLVYCKFAYRTESYYCITVVVKMSSDEETFEGAGAGASLTEPIRAGEVKKGMTVMLKGKPCKVSTAPMRCACARAVPFNSVLLKLILQLRHQHIYFTRVCAHTYLPFLSFPFLAVTLNAVTILIVRLVFTIGRQHCCVQDRKARSR